jgi:hypothetical protein
VRVVLGVDHQHHDVAAEGVRNVVTQVEPQDVASGRAAGEGRGVDHGDGQPVTPDEVSDLASEAHALVAGPWQRNHRKAWDARLDQAAGHLTGVTQGAYPACRAARCGRCRPPGRADASPHQHRKQRRQEQAPEQPDHCAGGPVETGG